MQNGLPLLGRGMAHGAGNDLMLMKQLREINIERQSQGQPPISIDQYKQMQTPGINPARQKNEINPFMLQMLNLLK